jgi:nucleoside-diphosphate-sugar epimerase
VTELGLLVSPEVEVVAGPPREGGTRRRCPDIRKVEALGYRPKVSFREGLARTADWYVNSERGGGDSSSADR